MRAAGFVLTCLLAIAGDAAGQAVVDLSGHFRELDGTFVLLDASSGRIVRHNPARAAERFAPCSTFKIPNTAILLESGAVPDPSFTLAYDPALKQPEQWARDFDLRGAFKASALWYYHAASRQAGLDVLQHWVGRFDYGNRDVSGGIAPGAPPFWIDGTLRISADEQVQFLRRFYEERLGLSERTNRLTKETMVADETPAWRLSAKTGACRPTGEDATNWYVGYVEKGGSVYYFALQIGGKEFGRAYKERVTIARAILKELGVLTNP